MLEAQLTDPNPLVNPTVVVEEAEVAVIVDHDEAVTDTAVLLEGEICIFTLVSNSY